MFLHKAMKPARLFVNRILALLRDMGPAASVAIDEGIRQDVRWFIVCAHAANGTVSIYKCLQPQTDIFVDASLSGLGGGALNAFVYRAPLSPRPGWSIAHWEAINVFVALQVFSAFISGRRVMVWCDSRVAVAILHSGHECDPLLHTIARNIHLLQSTLDCHLAFSHVPGRLNTVADLLSRWDTSAHPTASLFSVLNTALVWCPVPASALVLDCDI
jgi:hypothetical protein